MITSHENREFIPESTCEHAYVKCVFNFKFDMKNNCCVFESLFKIQKNGILLWKYCSSVLQTWHQKCTSQKEPNDTHCVVTMETLLAPFKVGQGVVSILS